MDPIRKPLVIIESPYAGDRSRNDAYLRAALWDSLARGEAPFASHAIYPQVLDDNDPAQRRLGVEAGFAWADQAPVAIVAVYVDLGISRGMQLGIDRAIDRRQIVERRSIPAWAWAAERGGC